MIKITVRTLDSQNHPFEVDEDLTVAQFKEKIAPTVNISSETQRIIFCGRVLTDEAKLSDLDVDGKVVHLVQRAPPSELRNERTTTTTPPTQHRVIGGNAMYVGSMSIPIEPQNLLPPPPSRSLAASRLNVARRMLRRAELIIHLLENPTARASDITVPEEPQEEVTPVFEARVIVPTASNATLDEAFVINAVQNSIMNAGGTLSPNSTQNETPELPSGEASNAQPANDESESHNSSSSSPEGLSPISTSTEDLTSDGRPASSSNDGSNNLADNASRTSEMADLLETLGRLQRRFAPFLERYQTFMRNDPAVNQEDARKTQTMMNRVSEVFHYLGHAYHSLSDIIIRVRMPPTRPLLCRPILIQHSAVLQAGFPIQAQINFSPENVSSSQSSTTQSNTSTTNTGTTTERAAPAGVQVHSIPIGVRSARPSAVIRTTRASANRTPSNNPTTGTATNTTNAPNSSRSININSSMDPNLEFFMEVTPESITIDSLETTLLGNNQGGMRHPSPELLHSLVQMANHIVRAVPGVNLESMNPNTTEAQSTESSTASASANVTQGQNSQARGNTQTNPTTATYTRSTARPHVQLAQHTMQGFDPFLPCNSHHITHRRRSQSRNMNNNNQATGRNQNTTPNQPNLRGNPMINIVQGVLSQLQNYTQRRNVPQSQSSTQTNTSTPNTTPATATPTNPNLMHFDLNQLFSTMPNFSPNLLNSATAPNNPGPTIAQLLQLGEQGGEPLEQGEGIFNDLIFLLSRSFTIADMLQLNAGQLEPLVRIRNDIRSFVHSRVLNGEPTPIMRGVNRLLAEMQPFLENLALLPVQDNIDIVRSMQMLFRVRLPEILHFALSRNANSLNLLVNHIKITSRHACALILHASSNGQTGVEDVVNQTVTRYMGDSFSPDVLQWTLLATRAQLHLFIRSLNVPTGVLQGYIVRTVDSVTSNGAEPMELDPNNVDELEVASGSNSVLQVINLSDSSENLPNVVIGSESWHNQVPADWVPIITRDSQRQRRQNQQSALSDAYLSGMPSKRRKIVATSKPQGSLPQVIEESMRRAVTATGLSQIGNMSSIARETGDDLNIQSAYRDLLRTRVQTTIQDNEDFTPDRFPNASNYFNKSQ